MNFLTAVSAAVLILTVLHTARAMNRLCINGDNAINRLYIDGELYTDKLKSAREPKHCDCIEIPSNTALIAVEASMKEPPGAIQECNEANPTLFEDWVCESVTNPRASSGNNPRDRQWYHWYKRGFDDKHWQSPRKTSCGTNRCNNNYYKLPCNMPKSPCFWTRDAAANTIRCRLKQCAELCTDCSKAGAGSCNPDACIHGSGTNDLTDVLLCQRPCRLEMKAFDTTSVTGDGYIKVTDVITGNVDMFKANKAGYYFATVDMSSCSITNRRYFKWSDRNKGTFLYNTWNNLGSGFLKVIGIELGVGSGEGSFAPWMLANSLGQSIAIPAGHFPNNKHTSYSADLLGVQHGDVAVTNNVTVPYT